MKHKVLRIIEYIAIIAGLVLVYGACGAADLDTITTFHFVKQSMIAVACMAVAAYIDVYLKKEGYEYEI